MQHILLHKPLKNVTPNNEVDHLYPADFLKVFEVAHIKNAVRIMHKMNTR